MVLNHNNCGFLFDLDGVLIDTHDLHWDAWQEMRDIRPDLSHLTYTDFKNGFGKSNESFLLTVVPTTDPEKRKALGKEKETLFRKRASGKISFLPGVEQFLQQIQKAKIPMIIASSSSIANMEFYLSETVIGLYFSTYVSAEHVPHGKPAPDIFIEAAHRIEVPIKSCFVLEDSLAGLEAARASKAQVIALATTYTVKELKVHKALFDFLLAPEELDLSLFYPLPD